MDYEILSKNALHFPRLLESPEEYISFCLKEASSLGIDVEPWISGGAPPLHIYGDMWILLRQIDSSRVHNLLDRYDHAVVTACEEYLKYLEIDKELINTTVTKIKENRPPALTVKSYFVGESLGPHPDIDLDDPEDVLHLTVSTYYNDDYEGGQLGIVGGGYIKPTPGSVVVFPSKYLHESTSIPNGIKYVSNEVIRVNSSFLKEF